MPLKELLSNDTLEWARHCDPQLGRDVDACRVSLAHSLTKLVTEATQTLFGRPRSASDAMFPLYTGRVWRCIEYHWREGTFKDKPLEEVIEQLKHFRPGQKGQEVNLLAEAILAEALERNEAVAADKFDRDYMPAVRGIAHRVAGLRAVERVDNFAAELVLPREGRPPRIARFVGRTTLTSWLRVVVTNYCLSSLRKKEALNVETLPETAVVDAPTTGLDHRPCEKLLRPLFHTVVVKLDVEDRVMIKMLMLDNVPQNHVAKCLKVHSGNITRRRQRIMESLLENLKLESSRHVQGRRVGECLEIVLAGDSPDLCRELGQALGDSLRSATSDNTEDKTP